MLPLVDTTYLVIEIRKWVGRWLEILVEGDTRMEGWIFQHKGREQMNIHDMDYKSTEDYSPNVQT